VRGCGLETTALSSFAASTSYSHHPSSIAILNSTVDLGGCGSTTGMAGGEGSSSN